MSKFSAFLAKGLISAALVSGGMLGVAPFAAAHHSFAVHFAPDKMVDVSGVVTSFHFANPHGVITFDVTDENGETVTWKGETNSPSILRRRGWSRDSIEPGDKITVHGWPAREGRPMVRVASVTLEDGSTLIGQSSAGGIEGAD